MLNIHSYPIQKTFREWFEFQHWNSPFAATLTLKQRIHPDRAGNTLSIPLTQERASQNLRHFLNLLNKMVYGSAASRFGKGVSVCPILEGGLDKRLHYHLMIDCPRSDQIHVFPEMIVEAWSKTQWGYHETKVDPADAGWIQYITKLRDKPDFATSIDWTNFHNH